VTLHAFIFGVRYLLWQVCEIVRDDGQVLDSLRGAVRDLCDSMSEEVAGIKEEKWSDADHRTHLMEADVPRLVEYYCFWKSLVGSYRYTMHVPKHKRDDW